MGTTCNSAEVQTVIKLLPYLFQHILCYSGSNFLNPTLEFFCKGETYTQSLMYPLRPGADQSSKAAFDKSAFAKACFLLLKIRLAHINRAKSKNAFEHVLAESIFLVARA